MVYALGPMSLSGELSSEGRSCTSNSRVCEPIREEVGEELPMSSVKAEFIDYPCKKLCTEESVEQRSREEGATWLRRVVEALPRHQNLHDSLPLHPHAGHIFHAQRERGN